MFYILSIISFFRDRTLVHPVVDNFKDLEMGFED